MMKRRIQSISLLSAVLFYSYAVPISLFSVQQVQAHVHEHEHVVHEHDEHDELHSHPNIKKKHLHYHHQQDEEQVASTSTSISSRLLYNKVRKLFKMNVSVKLEKGKKSSTSFQFGNGDAKAAAFDFFGSVLDGIRDILPINNNNHNKKPCGTRDADIFRKSNMNSVVKNFFRVDGDQPIIDGIAGDFFTTSQNQNQNQQEQIENFNRVFDVYFHVIYDGSTNNGYLSDEQIQDSIDVLNSGFAGNEVSVCSDGGDNGIVDDDYDRCSQNVKAEYDLVEADEAVLDKEIFQTNVREVQSQYIPQTEQELPQQEDKRKPHNHRHSHPQEHSSRSLSSRSLSFGSTEPGTGVSTGIQFVLKGITRTNNEDWFNNIDTVDHLYKPALHQGDCSVLNIYSGNSEYLGWANYPDECFNSNSVDDGVVIDYSTVPDHSGLEGDSLIHEVGHWLGLFHTFEGALCGGLGDYVGDTASQAQATIGCPSQNNHDTCSIHDGYDPIHNFMDYSDDCCMDSFTPNQRERMIAMIDYYRS